MGGEAWDLGMRLMIERAVAAEAAVDRLDDGDEGSEAALAADREARLALLEALQALGGPGPFAVALPDGTMAVRCEDVDGLAVLRPDRIHRLP